MLKNFRLLEHFILFAMLVGMDQFSKFYMSERAILNPGIIGGLFADIPPFIRVVILSSIGVAGVVFYFITILMLSHKKIHIVRIGSCIWIAGLFSNVIDRSLQGGVVDFININIGFLSKYSVNLADIFQIVGFVIFILGVFIQFEELFYPDSNRKSFYIDHKFQKKWLLISFSAFTTFGMFLTFFGYCFLKAYLDHQAGAVLPLFLISSLTITLLFSLSASLLTIMLTHRIVGPILAFKKYLNSVTENAETPNLKLRETDDFRDLEEFSAAIKTKLKR
jgi:signal peptidase II